METPRLNYDFVSVDPTKKHYGLTSSDRVKVRSRAAKNDPFSVPLHRKPKKATGRKPNDKSSALPSSTQSSNGLLLPDVASLEEQAGFLTLISPPISPDERGSSEEDEGYFSRQISSAPLDEPIAAPIAELVVAEAPIEILDANGITDKYKAQVASQLTNVKGFPSSGRVDPFWTFPIEFKACLPAVIHHEMHHLTPVVPGFDKGEERNLLRWFAQGLFEPAQLYATLAFAAAHLIDAGSPLVTQGDVLYLKCAAIAAVNEALGKGEKALRPSLIAAVMSLAAFEFAFGDTRSYDAHMEGGRMMIARLGGIQSLEPWMARFLKWLGGSSECWKIYWPYSRQMDLTITLSQYNRAQKAEKTLGG